MLVDVQELILVGLADKVVATDILLISGVEGLVGLHEVLDESATDEPGILISQ